MHCKIVAVFGNSKSVFSVAINDRKQIAKFSPLISDELNVGVLFDKGRHYDVQINISLSTPTQPVSIFLQSSAASIEILDQSCFACKSESILQPVQIQVNDPPATFLNSFDCSVQFNSKSGIDPGSSL
jgi:hypothetical protein